MNQSKRERIVFGLCRSLKDVRVLRTLQDECRRYTVWQTPEGCLVIDGMELEVISVTKFNKLAKRPDFIEVEPMAVIKTWAANMERLKDLCMAEARVITMQHYRPASNS